MVGGLVGFSKAAPCVRRLEAASKELALAKHAEELAKKQAAEDHASREKQKAGGRTVSLVDQTSFYSV